jgi:predicted nucleotide-binding protein
MARAPKQPGPTPIDPSVPPEKGIELLQRQIEAGTSLISGYLSSAAYQSWVSTTVSYLEKSFGFPSSKIDEFKSHGEYGSFPINATEAWWSKKRTNKVQGKLTLLAGYIDVLRTEIELKQPVGARSTSLTNAESRKVFVVHGHDTALQQAVARFLEKLDLEAVILDEQANQGRTVIQKFSDHSNVRFAIVLLTGDDVGGKKGTPPEELSPRARQNVILEFGYFLGKLGASAVCALYEPGVELPSDVSGMLYVPVEQGPGWKLKVGLELKAAGMDVDMNRIS